MDASRRRHAALLVTAAVLGVALRLAFGFGYWVGEVLTRDEREYLSLARGLASGRGFVYDDEILNDPGEPFGRAPGYPAFLALVGAGREVATSVPGSVKAAQAVVGAAGVFMVGVIATRLGGRRAGAAAAVLAAVYPPLVWISGYAFSEALFWPCGLILAWLFDRVGDRGGRGAIRAAVLCGLAGGVAILIRPGVLLFFPLAAIVLMRRRHFLPLIALALSSAAVVAPWTARNAVHHGRFLLVASDGGVTFWTGNHPDARGEGDFAANPHLRRDNDALRARHPGLSEEAMEPIYYREALRWIAAHPMDWLVLEARKLFYLVVPIGPSYGLHSTRYHAASVISYGFVLVAALLGLRRIGARAGRTPGLWLLLGSAVAVALVFFPQERFRIPIIDPALVICAGMLWAPARDEEARG